MRTVFLIFLFITSGFTFSQSNKINLLRQQLASTKKDSLKTSLLADIAWELLSWEQYDSVKFYAEKAEALAQLFKDYIEASNAQNTLGIYYRNTEDYDKALLYFQQSMENRRIAGSKKGIAMTHNNIGSVYMETKEYEKALGYFFFSMNLYEEMLQQEKYQEEFTGLRKSLGNSYNNIASIFYFRKEYQLALKYYRLSSALSYKYGEDRINTGFTMSNIARVYLEIDETDSCIVWFKNSLQQSEQVADSNTIAETTFNLGIAYQLKGAFSTARSWFEKSVSVLKPEKDNQQLSDRYFRIAWCTAGEKDFKTALTWYEKAFKIYDEMKADEKRKKCAQKMAEAHEALGNKKEAKKYKQLSS